MTTTTTVEPTQTITERLVSALTAAWRAIQRHHPEVPDVVLTLGSGTLGKRGGETTLGHFAAGRWQLAATGEKGDQDAGLHELFVSGEGLRRGAADVLGTLLHEAAHGLAAARSIGDTSRQGRYHNKKFKALGEELGLVITEVDKIGWSGTALGPDAEQRYADALAGLTAAMTAFRRAEVTGLPGKSKSKNLLVAECLCPRKIRVARATLDAAPITCGGCGQEFTAPDDSEDDDE
jgi:hypothetical protein